MKKTSAKSETIDPPLSTFRGFWNAVAQHDIKRLGIGSILRALIKLARARGPGNDLERGLSAMLQCYQSLEKVESRAMAGDPAGFGILLALATIINAMLAAATHRHPGLAAKYARASVTWPILQPFYESTKGDRPQDKLKALGFGENAKALRLRGFSNGFGLVAFLLHAFRILRAVIAEDADGALAPNRTAGQAARTWSESARATLDGCVPKLSDLPLDEVKGLQRVRQERVSTPGNVAEVSGDVRAEIKGWFVRLRGLIH
jgi:hypothetical protein